MSFLPKLNALFRVQKVKEVEGAHVWVVSWDGRTGDYSGDIKRVAKAFLLEEDANQFAESLQQAQDLLQNTNNLRIKIEKQL
jgi:ribosomal protein S4E